MWTTEISRSSTATREQIWQLWTDVCGWAKWDRDVSHAELFGPFRTGTKGVIKPPSGPKAHFVLTACTPLSSFTSRTELPWCQMDFEHTISEADHGIIIRHRVVMTGPLTILFSRLIGRQIKQGLPLTVDTLVRLAEKR